ncbi:MAG: DUF3566 domain-containing protein [Candidatus Thermoplasmatota archaeon]|nr:DUF3566 domain-containing protein [Candidatus Thermoplasmatota archaeon]MBU1940475.1 DUF3566 domain-containing protein [Candidatus Thermoplasmatota archaeon]
MVEGNVKLRRVGVWSVGKIAAVLGIIWGFIVGIFSAIGFMIAGSAANWSSMTGADPTGISQGFFGGLGILMIIVGPIIGAIMGLIGGIISAILYNIAAGWVGGIEMKFE